MKDKLERVINAVKDGYVRFVDAVERHPHVAAWAIMVLLVAEIVAFMR
jgi:hypothetical protein